MTQQAAPVTDYAPMCRVCGMMLAIQVSRPWRILCNNRVDKRKFGRNNCKTLNESEAEPRGSVNQWRY